MPADCDKIDGMLNIEHTLQEFLFHLHQMGRLPERGRAKKEVSAHDAAVLLSHEPLAVVFTRLGDQDHFHAD